MRFAAARPLAIAIVAAGLLAPVLPTSALRRDPGAPAPRASAPASAVDDRRHQPDLATFVSEVKGVRVITAARAKRFASRLDRLRKQGTTAIPAIAAFLDGGEDVDFTRIRG